MNSIEISTKWKELLIGQDHAIDKITPYVVRALAGLSVPGRPLGVFFLMGSTGCGKTRASETLAEVLHGDDKKLLRIDCAEFQLEHETAKMIGCFTPDTPVLMEDGSLKDIKDIQIGDKVISGDGTIQTVEDFYEYQCDGNILKIKSFGSREAICVTENHQIWAAPGWKKRPTTKLGRETVNEKYNKENFRMVAAKDLKEGDIVAYPRLKIDPAKQKTVLDLGEFVESNQNYILTETAIGSNRQEIPRFIELSKLARIFGYYVSEGGHNDKANTINFSFGPTEKHLVDEVIQLFSEIGIKQYKIFERSRLNEGDELEHFSGYRLYIYCKVLTTAFSTWFGTRCEVKQIPEWLLHAPDEIVWEFLDALYMGDGTRTLKRKAIYNTVSLTLATQLEVLVRRLGFITQWSTDVPNKIKYPNQRTRYKILVSGAQIENFVSHMKLYGPLIDLENSGAKGIQRMGFVDDEYVYTRIERIENENYQGNVHDFSVSNVHRYVAKSFVVSNSPPGYLGHRETQPLFTQAKVNAIASEKCNISIILFDEIEKGHASLHRILLGIMDKAILRLGDNTAVNFDQSLIFMSSNLAAKEIGELFTQNFGFAVKHEGEVQSKEIEKLGMGAMTKKFPPEFPNRLDEVITFKPLQKDTLLKITDIELQKIQKHVQTCLGPKSFTITYEDDTLEFLTAVGTSQKFGARELKRAINRYIMNPLADDIVEGKILPGSQVDFCISNDKIEWDVQAPVYDPNKPIVEVAAPVETKTTPETKRVRRKSTGTK